MVELIAVLIDQYLNRIWQVHYWRGT